MISVTFIKLSLLPVRRKFQLMSLWLQWLARLHLIRGIFLRVDNLIFFLHQAKEFIAFNKN